MGADLFLRSITDKAQSEWQPRAHEAMARRDALPAGPERNAAEAELQRCLNNMFPEEGQFRDPYNGSSILLRLGLSWADVKTHDGWIAGDNLLRLRALVAERDVPPTTREALVELRCRITDQSNRTVEGWHRYFEKKREELLAFLDRAIALGEPIFASL
jgi:hypothetical protein